jgi:hypothetical protein
LLDAQNANAQTASVHQAEGSALLPIELIIAAFVAAYVTVVAFGHVLLMAAIYDYSRADSGGGRGRRTAVRPQIATTPAEPRSRGRDAIIATSVTHEDVETQHLRGREPPKSHIRIVFQPRA